MEQDPDFKGYQTFERHWAQEISQMKRQAGQEGENSSYLTGMAQAVLLDRLAPGWKAGALAPGAFLEQLLRQAIGLPVAPPTQGGGQHLLGYSTKRLARSVFSK